MAIELVNNRIKFPKGYFKYPFVKGYDGIYQNLSPVKAVLGATLTFTLAAAPANHATEAFTAPNGNVFTFEILYPAALATAGNIGVPLASGAGSSAAQVATALLAVMNAGSVTPQGGVPTVLPWNMTQTGAAQLRVNFNVGGNSVGASGAVVASTDAIAAQSFSYNHVVPGRFGRNYAILPGT